MKLIELIKWIIIDIKRDRADKKRGIIKFKPFGLWMFTGRQGSGKTIGMVEQLGIMHKEYPNALICTNFDYQYANYRMKSLNDLLTIRNGEKGVIFAIDELQNEFSCTSSKNFPEHILSTITQQRKQRICILTTSQVFTRVAKPLREQCYYVIDCRTFFGRYTRLRCYDADDYNSIIEKRDIVEAKMKLHKLWKHSFVQTDELRDLYDTYAVIERLSREGFK